MNHGMKTIQISDEDYEALMELSKELQTQENHGQAFPYFWEPTSEKLVIDFNNEGEVKEIFDNDACEVSSPKEFAENHPELYDDFLLTEDHEDEGYTWDLEGEWVEYISMMPDYSTYSSNWVQSSDHNPSLFLSDVKRHVDTNRHHLGRNPRTYARTIQRMPKMEKLIKILYRLNPQPKDDINEEARVYI